jgi:hypothetical protein
MTVWCICSCGHAFCRDSRPEIGEPVLCDECIRKLAEKLDER